MATLKMLLPFVLLGLSGCGPDGIVVSVEYKPDSASSSDPSKPKICMISGTLHNRTEHHIRLLRVGILRFREVPPGESKSRLTSPTAYRDASCGEARKESFELEDCYLGKSWDEAECRKLVELSVG